MIQSFEQQVADQREYLLKFARLQLRNEAWAEDAVSETLLAALTKPQSFEYRSQLKTWLVGVLKHKIIDTFRRMAREVTVCDFSVDSDVDPLDYIGYQADGHFLEEPASWGDPEQDLNSRQFMTIMDACANKLPTVQGRLFLMREWLELSVDEICDELKIEPNNLYVQLHRARLRLRTCLEMNWFANATPSS